MDKHDSSSRLRSNQFPYHVTSGTPNMSKNASLAAVNYKRKDLRHHLDAPTTYMVVNFDDRFVESVPSEMPSIVRVDEKRTRDILDKIRNNSPNRANQKPVRIPKLASTYVLPRQINSESDRLMFRRADASTQTETNMNKINFEGMTGYQNWTAEVVEPFLKVRTFVWVRAFLIVHYCQISCLAFEHLGWIHLPYIILTGFPRYVCALLRTFAKKSRQSDRKTSTRI